MVMAEFPSLLGKSEMAGKTGQGMTIFIFNRRWPQPEDAGFHTPGTALSFHSHEAFPFFLVVWSRWLQETWVTKEPCSALSARPGLLRPLKNPSPSSASWRNIFFSKMCHQQKLGELRCFAQLPGSEEAAGTLCLRQVGSFLSDPCKDLIGRIDHPNPGTRTDGDLCPKAAYGNKQSSHR
jgi:hypothetical protein